MIAHDGVGKKSPKEPAMSDEACSLPVDPGSSEAEVVKRLLKAKRIAVVGLSDDPSRPSYDVSRYVKSRGKEIIPVNPNLQEVMGLKAYPSLEEVPGQIDLVNVFRLPKFCPAVVKS